MDDVLRTSARQIATSVSALCVLLSLVFFAASSASADDTAAQPTGLPTSNDFIHAIEAEGTQLTDPTNPELAENLPHQDLGREEALELLQGVFNAQLQAPAGIFDELEVEKFLTANVALIAGEGPPALVPAMHFKLSSSEDEEEDQSAAPMTEKEELRAQSPAIGKESEASVPNPEGAHGQLEGRTLLDSSVPLRTESPSGDPEAVDLSLEHTEGEIQPAAPLVAVGIPREIDEGIQLPGPDVTINLAGAPQERPTSIIDQSVGFAPNVAPDTDLAVAPTPTGVETLTQMRSAESPRSQTFTLDLPSGATVGATEDGGAAVKDGEETLVSVPSPTAIDATGASVPVSLDVSGDSLTLTVSPSESAKFPILVDPLFQTYEWAKSNYWQDGICTNSFKYELNGPSCNIHEEWGFEHIENPAHNHMRVEGQAYGMSTPVTNGTPGLYIATSQDLTAGDRASAFYAVPRYFSDLKYKDPQGNGQRPTSFISHMTLWNLNWNAFSGHLSPYLFAGIWDPFKPGWVSSYSHEGLTGHSVNDMNWQYQFSNSGTGGPNTNAKVGYVTVQATETQANQNAEVYVGSASIELGDNDVPGLGSISGPSQWINQTASPIAFTATDSGLGVQSLTSADEAATPHSWKTSYGCLGVGDAACPRTWQSTDSGPPALKYEPSLMPQGIHYLSVVAEDPVGNKSAPAFAQVKVDHIAPEVALSGTMTEQATLGTKRPTYALKVSATDGTAEQPQSGVAKVVVEVDNKVEAKSEPGCSTKNCAIALEWILESGKFSAGQHTVKVSATDAVGLPTTKTLTITVNPSPPSIGLSGSMTEQGTLGLSRPRYKLKMSASAEAGLEGPPAAPTYSSFLGSSGAGNGQFAHPGDVVLDAKGNLWVVDESNNRVEEFNEKGEFVAKFGVVGSGNGQLSRPTSLAIDAKGNFWVTDAGNNRVEEFNEKGEFVKVVGTYGAGNGQFSGPEGLAIDPKGNIWVSDTYNARVQKFNEKGEFVKVIGTKGSATGQLVEPTGIDIGPGGNVWVTDWANNRVEVFNETGEYVRQFGSEGTGNGQFKHPDALAVDIKGNVWVGDQNNERIQEFNQSGEYLVKFGSAGSGAGQFNFGYPMGITADAKGNLWVTDTGNNRLQKWVIPGYIPTYASAFGTQGAGNGQFQRPADVALDTERNLYVVDRENNRVEKFNSSGQFLKAFGSYGSGNGQLNGPTAITVDLEGHVWVTDVGNRRVEEFGSEGEYMSKFGTQGTGNGQFNLPEGIAIDPKGNIWVSNGVLPSRVQKFNAKGEFLKVVSAFGSGLGQVNRPAGIDIGPDGTVWVADIGNHRVDAFNEEGEFLRQWSGAGPAAFTPFAIDVDPSGTVWVGDTEHSRVEGFDQYGNLLTQFGTEGTGSGQLKLSTPIGIEATLAGDIWVTDPGNNRIQRWSWPNWRSEITTEITVDGKRVDSGQAGCNSEHCPLTREWAFESSAYSAGKHTVLAKATDGLGNTTTKSLTMEVQPDKTKPTLQTNGELVEAPEGWVEQESYGLSASATDSGYGVTSLAFKIDGQQVASASQTCADGGCPETLAKSVDMNAYSGGAHAAELIATDAAGNTAEKHWTINVDPEGHISTSEAEDTLRAVGETTDSDLVASTEELISPEERADGNDPSLIEGEDLLESRGVPNPSAISTDPEGGFTVAMPDATLNVQPVTVGSGSTNMSITEESAAVAGNTTGNVDTVIRPIFDGVLTFSSIRDKAASEYFSWEVRLAEGQNLKQADPMDAEIVYEDGTRAVLISAEEAHDAIGTSVPTALSVTEGNVLSLVVAHRDAPYVYPVVAGAGWEGGFSTEIVAGPKDAQEVKEEQERILQEEHEAMEGAAEQEASPGDEPPGEGVEVKKSPSAPRRVIVNTGAPEMYDWVHRKRRSKAEAGYCNSILGILHCDNWHTWEIGTWFWNGTYHHVGGYAWQGDTAAKCYSHAGVIFEDDLSTMGWSGPNPAPYGYGKYLNMWCNFRVAWFNINEHENEYFQVQDHLYGDGYQGQHLKEMDPPYLT
jgi:streptogramin lyase